MFNSISFWRKTRGLTQTELAEKTEIDQGIISDLENGHRDFNDGYAEKISQALLIPILQLRELPPLTIGQEGDIFIDRTSGRPAPGELPDSQKSKRSIRKKIGRIFFLTPSQARVGIERQTSWQVDESRWERVRVYVEMPCEPEENAINLTKAYVANKAGRFLKEETRKIQAEYNEIFNKQLSEEFGYDSNEPGISEDDGKNGKGLSGSGEESIRKVGPETNTDGNF